MRLSYMLIARAGEIVRAIWSGGDLGIVEKTGKDDLQTQADRRVLSLKVTCERFQCVSSDLLSFALSPPWLGNSQDSKWLERRGSR